MAHVTDMRSAQWRSPPLDASFRYVPAVATSVASTWLRAGQRPTTDEERKARERRTAELVFGRGEPQMRRRPSRTDRNERHSRLRALRGVFLFVLGVIMLSCLELGLAEHVHGSMEALYVASASDLAPVLREWTNDTSAIAPDPTDRRSLARVRSSPP